MVILRWILTQTIWVGGADDGNGWSGSQDSDGSRGTLETGFSDGVGVGIRVPTRRRQIILVCPGLLGNSRRQAPAVVMEVQVEVAFVMVVMVMVVVVVVMLPLG